MTKKETKKIINSNYKIKSSFFLLNDEESAKYHLLSNDYFGTIATIISLVSQKLKLNKLKKEEKDDIIKILENLENDLVFIQNNYRTETIKKLNNSKNEKEENNTKRKTK